ncbi:MAG: metalloregulator ArsR/SmtB family transcription factor [Rectinemataceae bacterium]|nr:metalloregulator ArsR/SmtB family transcription factor [Rectinemataceae bacterium]
MDSDQRERVERRARLLKSLAHPSRLLIVELLAVRPHDVSELTQVIGADITTVSKHLTVLKKAGIVRNQRRGQHSDYELSCTCINHFIECIESDLKDKKDL